MARPSKSASTFNGKISKDVLNARKESEERLKGGEDMLLPPEHLNDKQKEIFTYIVEQMRASKILGNLDVYILESCVIAIDRLQGLEALINSDPMQMLDKDVMRARKDYRDTFFRCCNELSLSPQSRAKIGVINVQKKQEDEDVLLKVLRGGKK